MAAAGLGLAQRLVHGEAAPPGFVARVLTCQKLVERNRGVLGPQPAGRTKIRDSAFGRDPSACERDDRTGLLDQGRQPFGAALEIGRDHGRKSMVEPVYSRAAGRVRRFGEVLMRYLHTMLRVRNLDAALDFYCNKLGLKEARRVESEKGRFT